MDSNTRLIDVLLRVFLFYISNAVVLVIFLIAGLVIGSLRVYFKETVYKSTLTAYSAIADNSLYAELLNPLADKSGNDERLVTLLDMDPEKLSSIQSVSISIPEGAEEIQNLETHYERNIFSVEVMTTDPGILPEFQTKLFEYLNRSSFIKSQLEHKTAYVQGVIDALNEEISFLDSTKALGLDLLAAGNLKDYLNVNVSSTSPETEFLSLHQTLEKHRLLLQQMKAAIPITNFEDTVDDVNENWFTISIFGLLFFVIGLLIISFKELVLMARNTKFRM